MRCRGDASPNLARAERLYEIVIGARLEPLDARVELSPLRHDDDRKCSQRLVGADRFHERDPIDVWHHEIGNNEIWTFATHCLERGTSVRNHFDVVLLRE